MSKLWLGYIELTIAQIAVGTAIVLGKQLITLGVPVYMQMEVRFVCCFLLLILMVLLKGLVKKEPIPWKPALKQAQWGLLLAQSICAGVLFNYLMLFGLKYTTATMAGIIASVLPAVIAVLSFTILKETLSRSKLIAISLAIAGVMILHLDTFGQETASNAFLGGFFVFLALIPEGLYTVFAKILGAKLQPLIQAAWINFISVLIFTPFWIYKGGLDIINQIEMNAWIALGVTSFCSMLFYYLWTSGVGKVHANTAAIFTGVMPITTTVIAIFWLGEAFTIYDAIGLSCVLLSIIIGAEIISSTNTNKNEKNNDFEFSSK